MAICVVDAPEPYILLAKRCPEDGGSREDSISAAARETAEEIGLVVRPDAAQELLDDFVTCSGFVITAVAFSVPCSARPRRDPVEVQSVHRIRLTRLGRDDLPRWRPQQDGPALPQMPMRHDIAVRAPTGALLWQLREAGLLGRHTRVDGVVQSAFTRL
ncbi:hypothetical protein ACFXPA_42190 [Amycolatopsis sp. NPDC059090]|uniref:hypothetical protein n=1 Tax=Amycolatopsis sp. NPDC059090 TaxID=3346723 RepID=UPI00366E296D